MLMPFHFAYHVTDLDAARRLLWRDLRLCRRAQHRDMGGFRFLRPSD